MEKESFGYQLVLDLYDCKKGVCDDLNMSYKFLDEIVVFLGMEKQAPPSVFISDSSKYPDKAGISGWVPLIESSVVIHTLSVKNFISVDVYSCKKFDSQKTEQFVKNYFFANSIESQFFQRGFKYFDK